MKGARVVVAGIVGRAELFSFCFGCAGIQAFRRAERRPAGRWLIASALLFFAALCSKESAIAWLPFLPCYVAARAWRAGAPAAAALSSHLRGLLFVAIPVIVVFFALRAIAVEGFRDDRPKDLEIPAIRAGVFD